MTTLESPSLFERELFQQPHAVHDSLEATAASRGELAKHAGAIERVLLVGCGDPFYIGHAAVPAFEALANIPAETIEAYDFVTSRAELVGPGTMVIGTSASGKSIYTLTALKLAASNGALPISVSNDPASPIAGAGEYALVTDAGPTRTFPTKTTTSALAVILALAADMGQARGHIDPDRHRSYLSELTHAVPDAISACLTDRPTIAAFADAGLGRHVVFVGNGPLRAAALLGAAKIRETCHEPASACNAEEYLHLFGFSVGRNDAVVLVALNGDERAMQAAQYAARYAGSLLVVANGGANWPGTALLRLPVDGIGPSATALVASVPLQLLALELSRLKGSNPDRPEGVDLEFVLDLLYTSPLAGWR